MPARQKVGQGYFQEFAAKDEALDLGKTHAVLPSLRVAGVNYANVLRVLETNPFEPNDREFKYYAPRVGLIRIEEGLNLNLRNPELVFNLRPAASGTVAASAVAPVPLPAPLALLLGGFAALAALARRRRTFMASGSRASSA